MRQKDVTKTSCDISFLKGQPVVRCERTALLYEIIQALQSDFQSAEVGGEELWTPENDFFERFTNLLPIFLKKNVVWHDPRLIYAHFILKKQRFA